MRMGLAGRDATSSILTINLLYQMWHQSRSTTSKVSALEWQCVPLLFLWYLCTAGVRRTGGSISVCVQMDAPTLLLWGVEMDAPPLLLCRVIF